MSARDRDPDHFTLRDSCQGGFAYIAPLFNTHTFALVGSANNPKFTSTRVHLWDEHEGTIKDTLRFRSEVKNVMLRRDYIVIICEAAVYVYSFSSMEPVSFIETDRNEHGVGAISYQNDRFILATLGTISGHIRIENFYSKEITKGPLHDNPISMISLDYTGNLGASASEQGTIIRVFNCDTFQILQEFRRGSRPASISSLTFSPSLNYLVGASDHGTLHVWQLQRPDNSYFGGFVKNIMPTYFSYDRSIAKLTLPCTSKLKSRYTTARGPVSCFTSETDLMVANLDGLLYKCTLNASAGTLTVRESISYIDNAETDQREWASM